MQDPNSCVVNDVGTKANLTAFHEHDSFMVIPWVINSPADDHHWVQELLLPGYTCVSISPAEFRDFSFDTYR